MSITWINRGRARGCRADCAADRDSPAGAPADAVLPYPSLRFLRETALAAFRRRAIQDAALLVCRIAIIAAAVTALAGPVLQTRVRTAGYANRRFARRDRTWIDGAARVDVPGDVFRTATFDRTRLADAIADAFRWLDAQPPSAREIVLRRIVSARLDRCERLVAGAADIGLRFVAGTA